MVRLDCSTVELTLVSLARLGRRDADALRAQLAALSEEALNDDARRDQRPHEEVLAKLIFGVSAEDISQPDETIWFHGTRVARDTDFSDGLLPLDEVLPSLRAQIQTLAYEVGVPRDGRPHGEMSGSHSAKLDLLGRSGPNGSLLRDAVVAPSGAQRDYLFCPEIVEDLAEHMGGPHASDVLDLYRRRTHPCIVWFVSRDKRPDAISRALMYAWASVNEDEDPGFWNTCFEGWGRKVPFADIVRVEWLIDRLDERGK